MLPDSGIVFAPVSHTTRVLVGCDFVTLGRGTLARSNAEQVQAARRIVEGLGLSVASPDEARAILALKGDDRVVF